MTASSDRRLWVVEFIIVPFLEYYLELRGDAAWDDESFDTIFSDLVRQVRGEPVTTTLIMQTPRVGRAALAHPRAV